jgi:hypothetical protein
VSQVNQFQSQLRLLLVGHAPWFHLGAGRPPEWGGGHKELKARGTEAPSERNLVNRERFCYASFHHGVPPRAFSNVGVIGTPHFFKRFLRKSLHHMTKKAKLVTLINSDR